MKYTLLIVFLSIFIISCKKTDCAELPQSFSTYKQVHTEISKHHFLLEEKIKTRKSSWIRSIKYKSCDRLSGFLILETNTNTYTHKNLPIDKWNSFKESDSFGSYYTNNIKGKYQLILKD